MTRPERIWKLADWLELQAQHEDGSADALARMGSKADPRPAQTRARLFREIGRILEGKAVSDPSLTVVEEAFADPPSQIPSPSSGKSRPI